MQRVLTRTTTQDWGFTISRQGTLTVVSSLTPLSIAQLGDLRIGDFINDLNGHNCSRTPLSVLVDLVNSSYHLVLNIARPPTNTTPAVTPRTQTTSTGGKNSAQVIELVSDDDEDDDDEDMEDDDGIFGYGMRRHVFSDDDDSVDSRSSDAYHRNLARVRERQQIASAIMNSRQRPPASAGAAAPRAPVPYTPGEVVDLLSSDDEAPRQAAARTSAPAPTRAPTTAAASAASSGVGATTQQLNRTATAPSSSNSSSLQMQQQQQQQKLAASASASASAPVRTATAGANNASASNGSAAGKRPLEADAFASGNTSSSSSTFKRRKVNCGGIEIKIEFEPKKFGEANIGDDVIEVIDEDGAEVAAQAAGGVEVVKPATLAAASAAAEDDDFEGDFQIVGTTMHVASDMPHQRYSCTTHAFRMEPPLGMYGRAAETPAMLAERRRLNEKHCANCYCYVCDCKVAECLEWAEHCHATHKDNKWKVEKDARNSKLLKLMSGAKRSAFFARYRDATTPNRVTGRSMHATFLDSDENEDAFLEADLAWRLQSQALAGTGTAGVVRGVAGLVKDLTKTTELLTLVRLKLFTSRLALDRDRFIEASELLLRALTSMRHAGENPYQVGSAFIAWLFHPLCVADIRNVVRAELASAAARNMVLGSPVYVGLRNLLELPDAALNTLRQPSSGAGVAQSVPAAVVSLTEQIQTVLIAELMTAGNFAAIKFLAQRRPALAHSLMVLYIRHGSAASCAEAVDLACQVNVQQRPFVALRAAILDAPTDKLLRFLGAGIAYNVRQQALKGTTQAGWSLSGDCTDMVFGILLLRHFGVNVSNSSSSGTMPLCDLSAECAAVSRYASAATTSFRLDNISGWLEQEGAVPSKLCALLAFLFVSYANWRVVLAAPTMTLNVSTLSNMLITPAVFAGLRAEQLILLANCFRRHFVTPPVMEQQGVACGVGVGTVLACYIAQKALPNLGVGASLGLLDQPIRSAWMNIPELRKAARDEICTSSGPARQVPVASSSSSAFSSLLELRFCHVARSADRTLNVPNPSTRQLSGESPRIVAHYCDLHYTYDTFLLAVVAPKNIQETNTAQACWSHSLSLSDATQLLKHLSGAPALTPEEEPSSASYVGFLAANREILLMTWKTVARHLYSYMHALFYMDNAPLTHLLGMLSSALKPWLSSVDVLSAAAISAHPQCQGFTSEALVELQALDLTLRMLYHFANLLGKYQDIASAVVLPLADLRAFKAAVMRLENVGTNAPLAARVCHMCLLEFPTVSTRAVWHSFWRRFLQALVSKRNSSTTTTDEVAWELQATLLLLEDWNPLKDLVNKAAGSPRLVTNFIMGLTLLQKSDFSTMNYGAVSGMQVLKGALEPIAWTKFTVPLAPNQLQPLPLISEKCVDLPESGLAHLVLQFGPEMLQHGALDFQPYFTLALRRRAESISAVQLPGAEAALKLTMQAHEDCVGLVSGAGRNPTISYAKVLCGCVGLGRMDLVQRLVAAGFASILHPVLPSNPQYSTLRVKALSGALLMAHNQKEFELLLPALDPLIAEVYTDMASISKMVPVLKKFCRDSGEAPVASVPSAVSTMLPVPESAWIKQLKFYHHYSFDTFFDYWSSVPVADKDSARARLLAWTSQLEGTPRFRTDVAIAILSQMMDRSAFATFLSSPQVENPAYDKYQVMQALVKIIAVDPSSAPLLAPVLVRNLFALTSFTPSMHVTLLSVCKPSILPAAATVDTASDDAAVASARVEAYSDARTLLLYLGDPDTHAEALGTVYEARYSQAQKQGLCHILLDRDRPEPVLKLLLKARDYPQLFWALRDVYYGGSVHALTVAGKAIPVALIALALEKVKSCLSMANVYNASLVGGGGQGNAGLSLFQKELFDDNSFVVCLAKFLLFLQSQHIDDKMVAYPSPLGGAIDALLAHVRELAHGDVIVYSYLRLHVKFTTAHASFFHTDCAQAGFHTMPYTPSARSNTSTPSSLWVDALRSIAQAPKFYTLALSMVAQLFQLRFATSILGEPQLNDLVRAALCSPCTYHRDGRQSFESASGGVLSLPRADSSGASSVCSNELVKLINTQGSPFCEVLVGPIIQRLVGGTGTADAERAELASAALQQWSLTFTEDLKRVVYALNPVAHYGHLSDLFELHKSFQQPSLLAHVEQGLTRPYAAQYRKIVFKLAALAITSRTTNMRQLLLTLTLEFHHPNNAFTTFFTAAELDQLSDLILATEDARNDVRVALIAQGKASPVPAKCLLRIPRVLGCLTRDFATLSSYELFAALNHAGYYSPLWAEVAATGSEHSDGVFKQAVDCFRAIVDECKRHTVNARTRGLFEEAMQGFAAVFAHFPDKATELRALKVEAKGTLKSKVALVKAMSVLC